MLATGVRLSSARTLGTVGLVLILFEGGLTAGWREIKPVLGTALSMGILGTLITALIASSVIAPAR